MSNLYHLIHRYLDDRDNLDEEEMDRLSNGLEEEEVLLGQVKEQMILSELLSQHLNADRSQFLARLEQRIREEESTRYAHTPALSPTDLPPSSAISSQIREHAQRNFERWSQHTRRTGKRAVVIASVILVAVLAALGYWYFNIEPHQMRLAEVRGEVFLYRGEETRPLEPGERLRKGDELEVTPRGSAEFLCSDGTKLSLSGSSRIRLEEVGSVMPVANSWTVTLLTGHLVAHVEPQPRSAPMIFQTPIARVTVTGTDLQIDTDETASRVRVRTGEVELVRLFDDRAVTIGSEEVGFVSHSLPPTVQPGLWPASTEDLLFVFKTRDSINWATSLTGQLREFPMNLSGQVEFNSRGALVFENGVAEANEIEPALLQTCLKTGEISIEAMIKPAEVTQTGPARIVTFSHDSDEVNFSLVQEGDQLQIRLQTSENQWDQAIYQLSDVRPCHVVVTYQPGRLSAYVDGDKVFQNEEITGDLSTWKPLEFALGNEWDGSRPWKGTLEAVALYSRTLNAEEIRLGFQQYQQILKTRLLPSPTP